MEILPSLLVFPWGQFFLPILLLFPPFVRYFLNLRLLIFISLLLLSLLGWSPLHLLSFFFHLFCFLPHNFQSDLLLLFPFFCSFHSFKMGFSFIFLYPSILHCHSMRNQGQSSLTGSLTFQESFWLRLWDNIETQL